MTIQNPQNSPTIEMSHRVNLLEAHRDICDERYKQNGRRLDNLEQASSNTDNRIELISNVNIETLATLTKMQETLEQLNVVLVAFNKWENTKSGIKDIGDTLLWISKVAAVVAVLWTAVHFTKNNSTEIPINRPAISSSYTYPLPEHVK